MRPIGQTEHARINAREYPGTRQMCCICDQPTERCEEDTISIIIDNDELSPLCIDCYHEKEGEL